MEKRLERILPRVQKPARYTGGEYGEIIKDKTAVKLRMALCFPDTYEIGMSNIGIRILYGIINEMPEVWCERCFAPWGDMEDEMRTAGIPLWALESGDSLREFDVVAFSLGYEMAYTNVLNMLDLAGIPIRRTERDETMPLICAGGTSCCNSEPMSDFIDLFFIGEGEDLDREVLALCLRAKEEGWNREQLLRECSKLQGVYVPSLYEVSYNEDGTVSAIEPKDGAPMPVLKRIVEDFENSYFPTKPIVPSTEIVQDRVSLEIFRGCIRGCRFCQAGYAYRPVRSRSAERLIRDGIASLQYTGSQEITLASLSTSDYRPLASLCDGLLDYCEGRSISLSLPSLRADNFSMDIMKRVQKVRKSGLTFAPEAGSQRLRDVINKNVTEEDLLRSCRVAFEGGWNGIKLYFMLGLPTETDEDVLAIAALANKVYALWRECSPNRSRGVRITVSTSCFVPKPHSPFQWEAQVAMEEYSRRVKLLRENIKNRAIIYNWHDPDTSLVEAVLSRGDRRLGAIIEKVWKAGGRMESWGEYFSLSRWLEAFEGSGLTPEFYANRCRDTEEVLPWSVISLGVKPSLLAHEREMAYQGKISPDCRVACSACGAAALLKGGKCDG